MATIAEILIGQAGQAGTMKQGGDPAQSFVQGASLAMEKEKLEQQKAALSQKKQELETAKMDKFIDALQKGAAYQGSARTNYYQKWLPKYRDSLGLTAEFGDESLKFATATPENLARIQTLVAKVQDGEMSRADAIATINNPTQFADIPPEIIESAYKELDEAAKTAIGAEAQSKALQAANIRFATSENRQEQQFSENKKEALGKEVLKLDLPTLGSTLKRIDSLIPGGIDNFKGGDVPGLGGYRAKLPIGQVTPAEREKRQAIQRLGNSYVKLVTGSGGSVSEMNRILGSIGLDQAIGEGGGITTLFTGAKSSKDVVQGIKDIKAAFKAQESVLANTYGKEAYESIIPASSTVADKRSKQKNETSGEKTVADKAVSTVATNLQALYDKYKGDPTKQARIAEQAKAKGLKLKAGK